MRECRAKGESARCCWEEYSTLYRNNDLNDLPPSAKDHWPSSCPDKTTLERWLNATQAEGDLEDKRGKHRKGTGRIQKDPELRKLFDAAISQLGPGASDTKLLKLPQIKDTGISRGAILNYLNYLKTERPTYWLALINKKEYRNSGVPKFGSRSNTQLLPNDLWELDFTRNDLVLDLEGSRKRFAIGGLIDVATRRRLFILSTAPRGQATADLLVKAVTTWGIPKLIKPDNGKEFLNQQVLDFCRLLDINIQPCPPGKPEAKPHIERLFGVLNHDKIPLLPPYVGHNVATRQALRENKSEKTITELAMNWSDFETWLEAWRIESENTRHDSLGMSPNEKLQEFIASGWQPTQTNRPLDYLRKIALKREVRTVNTAGIQYQGRTYIAKELGNLVRQTVKVLIDHQDPRHLWVLDPDSKDILCEAVWRDTCTDQELITIATQAKRAASVITQEAAKASQKARQSTKALTQNPLNLFSENTRNQVAAMQASAAAQADALNQATQGKLRDPENPNIVPFPVASQLQATDTAKPFGQDALEDTYQTRNDFLIRLWMTPKTQWAETDHKLLARIIEAEPDALDMYTDCSGAAEGVLEEFRRLARYEAV